MSLYDGYIVPHKAGGMLYWVILEKNHTATTEGTLVNVTAGNVNSSANSDGRGALNLNIHPQG